MISRLFQACPESCETAAWAGFLLILPINFLHLHLDFGVLHAIHLFYYGVAQLNFID